MFEKSVKVLVTQLCLTLCCCMDCSPPASSVNGIFQARILEWVPFPPSGDFPDPGIKPTSSASPALAGRFFTTEPSGKPNNDDWHAKISSPTRKL